VLQEGHPDMPLPEVRRRAEESFFLYLTESTYGMIRRIASAMGHHDLTATFSALEAELGTLAVRLVNLAIRLDQDGSIPEDRIRSLALETEKHAMARLVLIGQVMHHFHMFDARYDAKQRICQVVGIEYKSLQGISPRHRLLAPGKPS
jgi:hypothetical protein